MHPACIEPEKLYSKDRKLKREDVKILQEWLNKQPHLPQLEESQVVVFLHSCNYRIEPTKITIDKYFTRKTHHPDVFHVLDENNIRNCFRFVYIKVLPKPTPQGNIIFFMRLRDPKLDKFNFMTAVNLTNMVATFHWHRYGPENGVVGIFDTKGFSLGHLARFNLATLKHELDHIQEGLPVRIKGVHFINTVSFMDKILALLKPFLHNDLYNLIQLHPSFETFYKYFPKEYLPEDYGGDLPPLQLLQDEYQQDMLENMDFFHWHDSQKVDESKRAEKLIGQGSVFGVEGTFKKLELD